MEKYYKQIDNKRVILELRRLEERKRLEKELLLQEPKREKGLGIKIMNLVNKIL